MSTILSDGSVIPSYLNAEQMGARSPHSGFSNLCLRQGEVKDVLYPDDSRNVSKIFVEYNVVVQVRNGNGPAVSVLYPNCTVANLFGGIGDKSRYTLRGQTKEPDLKRITSDGSKVLILCVNGETRQALIVGGISEDKTAEKKEDGHSLFFEFNGAQGTINKDGELQIRFRGATDAAGKLTESAIKEAEGSTAVFDKYGGIKVYTPQEKQSLFLDNQNKKLTIQADEEFDVSVNGKTALDVGKAISVRGGAGCSIEIQDTVSITSSGVHVGAATDAWLLASTYRRAETIKNDTLKTALSTLSSQVTTAGAALLAASPLMLIPMTGAALAAPSIAAAAAAITSMVATIGTMMSAIATFESQSSSYLSTKNLND